MKRLTNDILLVEDDAGQACLAEKVLARAGFDVQHVGAAGACLEHIRRQPPTFVLLDRGLPDGDGLDVLRAVRSEFPDVNVIMLTGFDDAGVAVEALREGALDYLVKRADLSHLSDLPHVLDRNRQRLLLLEERDTLDRAVRDSERRFRDLFENASDAIFVCDCNGVLQQVNEAFAMLIGRSRDAIEHHDLSEFLTATSPICATDLRERSLGNAPPATVEVHLIAPDGHTTVLDVTTRPILTDATITGFQGIGRDVTQRRQVEQMKADFLAMVTHDMKNPVSIIVGYTEILLNDAALDLEWREMLVSIDSSARGLLHLIMNFLDLSKIEAGALHLRRSQTCINDVLRQVGQYEKPLARAKRIELVEQFGSLPPLQLDRTQMDRVFVNIVGNAIKFTPTAGRVSITTSRRDGHVEVRISDTGPGIPPDQYPHLFGKYQRLGHVGETEGTGLGLFIAKSMVEAHGGEVRAEGAPKGGATFIVSLPIGSS